MRRLSLTFAALALLCNSFAAPSQKDTLRLLSVANSFGADAVEQNLHEIAEADGHVLIIGNLYIGGCYLEKHYNNAVNDAPAYSYRKIAADGTFTKRPNTKLSYAFDDEPWDIVVFHQASGMSGQIETYEPYLTRLLVYATSRTQKKCRMMLNQTWAYATDAVHEDFPKYNCSQKEMYNALCDAYKAEAKKHKLEVIPSGTAVQNSRKTANRENVTRDGYHLSLWFGRYLVACTYYEAIYKTSVVGNAYKPLNLTENRIRLAQNCAHAACEHPFEVTKVEEDPEYFNADPRGIKPYTLPDPLVMKDGRKVETAQQWYKERRPELLEMFETEMFGKAPGKYDNTSYEVLEEDRHALEGKAIRKQLRIKFGDTGKGITVLMYLPANAKAPVPVFLGVNFKGNAAIISDPAVLYPENLKPYGIFPKVDRGAMSIRWPVESIIARGYGVATFHTSDIDPDFDDGFKNGVHSLFYKEGQNYPKPDEWGSISAWAWGLSRVLDYLETDADVDAKRVAVIGHSRLGKTSLLAGARDERFALVISNCSGCCGAAISRRRIGETVDAITRHFPHWFCGNYFKYANKEDELPFDQHELLALVAPRPVYVASAELDGWADPVGERLALQEAQKVYDFLGLDRGLTGYHIREGIHAILPEDWNHYLDFADRYLK